MAQSPPRPGHEDRPDPGAGQNQVRNQADPQETGAGGEAVKDGATDNA